MKLKLLGRIKNKLIRMSSEFNIGVIPNKINSNLLSRIIFPLTLNEAIND